MTVEQIGSQYFQEQFVDNRREVPVKYISFLSLAKVEQEKRIEAMQEEAEAKVDLIMSSIL